MRYTTILDITEDRALYRNQAARLTYLHLVLKSGYHDDDRDIARVSLRSLAADVGLTLSAVRHAVAKLEASGYIEHTEAPGFKVRKWVPTVIPTSRKQVKMHQADIEAAREREEKRIERERQHEEQRLTFDERMEAARRAYEKDPNSLQGKAYQYYLEEKKKKSQK